MKAQLFKHVMLITLIIHLLLASFAAAQEKQEITVEWLYSEESRIVTALPSFVWLNDGTALLFDVRKPRAERTIEKLDPATGRRIPAIDMKAAISSLKSLLGRNDSLPALPWPLSFDDSGRRAVYVFQGDIYLLELSESRFYRVSETGEIEKSARFSPDGKKLAFVRSNDLYVYDIERNTEKRITRDGSETILNGTLSWVYWEEIFARRDIAYWWSDDSEAIAFLQTDESPVGVMHYLDFKPDYPRVITQRYPKAGTANPIVNVKIAEISSGTIHGIGLKPPAYEYIARVKWLPDSRRISVVTMNRNQDVLDLYFVDRFTGDATHILKERNDAWVNVHDDLYFLKDGKHFIWSSDRDGYAHLYRYAMDGRLVNRITKGDWTIRASSGPFWLRKAVAAIDEENGWIYFTALEKSSIERHLYRIRYDGDGMQRLSQEDGTHAVSFSPDAKYYFDRYSNISTLPSLSLYTNEGRRSLILAEPRPGLLAKYDMQYPELMTIPADDGFPLPAQMLKPKDFNPEKRYPVIIYVYGGPSAPRVSNSWQSSNYFGQILLREGYLFMQVDNRSATAISKKLEAVVVKELYGDNELRDLLAAVKWLKSQPYVDPDRVGIWGASGGGCYTLLAMTRSKEFKAGISQAGVTHFHYTDSGVEYVMKLPQDNPEGYEKTALVNYAKDLHGRLLLVHGTYDDNVHIQNTWHFVDELIKAGKMFDMMIYPMRKHGFRDNPARIHLRKTMIEFWKKNL